MIAIMALNKSTMLLIACLALAVANELVAAAPSQPKYSGEWLAKELGLNSQGAAEQALDQLKNSKAPTEQDFQASGQVEADLMVKANQLQQLASQQQFQQAVEQAKPLIAAVQAKLEKATTTGEKQLLTQFLFNVYLEKIKALYMSRQAFEALLNGLKMQSLCGKYVSYGCTGQQLHTLQSTMSFIEQAIKTSRPADALGLDPAEVGDQNKMRANRRRIRALLHPDKNRDLSEEAAQELNRIFNLANVTYEQLLVQSRR